MAITTPPLQQRSQYHRDWGNFTDPTNGVAGPGDLPNQGSNVLPAAQFTLEAGDIAYVDDSVSASFQGRYHCTDPGTAGGGDAVWEATGGGGGGGTSSRDAHAYVVGISSEPYASAGDSVDFLDTGNGAQLAAALAAAAALPPALKTVDIRIRAGTIDLTAPGAPALPLVVPDGVRLIGAGFDKTFLTGPGTVLAFGQVCEMEDLTIRGNADGGAADTAQVRTTSVSGMVVRRCSFGANIEEAVNTIRHIHMPNVTFVARGNRILVEDCTFLGGFTNGDGDPNGIGVEIGTAGSEGTPRVASFQNLYFADLATGIIARDIYRSITMRTVDMENMGGENGDDAVALYCEFTAGVSPPDVLTKALPRVEDVRCAYRSDPFSGFVTQPPAFFYFNANNELLTNALGLSFDSVQALVDPDSFFGQFMDLVRVRAGSSSQVVGGSLDDLFGHGVNALVRLVTEEDGGIQSIAVSNSRAVAHIAGGLLEGFAGASGSIAKIGFVNNDFSDAQGAAPITFGANTTQCRAVCNDLRGSSSSGVENLGDETNFSANNIE